MSIEPTNNKALYYAGMTKADADSLQRSSKNIIIDFNAVDTDHNGVLSEREADEGNKRYSLQEEDKGSQNIGKAILKGIRKIITWAYIFM